MTLIVAVAGQKGGAGKSTVAISLAVEWHSHGQRVLLVDADPQGTSQTWADVASEKGHDRPNVVTLGDGLRKEVLDLADRYDIVVIDCSGRAGGKRTAGALLVSDLVLLPCGPAAPDIWALAESIASVERAMELRPELRARILLNRGSVADDSIGACGAPGCGHPRLEQSRCEPRGIR